MGEAHLLHVRHQFVGDLAVRLAPPPRPEVHLVHAHRLRVRLARGPAGQPLVVAPGVGRAVDDGGVGRRRLGPEGERVGLLTPDAVAAEDVVPVEGAVLDAGDEQFPDAAAAHRPHRMAGAVPEVEVADHADTAGVRRPDGERRAGHRAGQRVVAADMGAEHLPQLLVPAFADEVEVHVAERRQVAVRVVGWGRSRRRRSGPRGGSRGPPSRAGRPPRLLRTRVRARPDRLGPAPRTNRSAHTPARPSDAGPGSSPCRPRRCGPRMLCGLWWSPATRRVELFLRNGCRLRCRAGGGHPYTFFAAQVASRRIAESGIPIQFGRVRAS